MLNIINIYKFFIVYFTLFPYLYYNYSTYIGNLGLAGVARGLIISQIYFWISNVCSMIAIYNIINNNFFYCNIILLFFCIFLYIKSFLKVKTDMKQ